MAKLPEPAYGSWMEPMIACLAMTSGAVLEVGVGDWSTPLLHLACAGTGRRLVSLDEDRQWIAKFADYREHGHELHGVRYDDVLPGLAKQQWSIVFLDQSPGWRRAPDALLFLDTAEWIIVHDYSGDEEFETFQPILHNWQTKDVFTHSPATLLLSRGTHLPLWNLNHAVLEKEFKHRLRLNGQYPMA